MQDFYCNRVFLHSGTSTFTQEQYLSTSPFTQVQDLSRPTSPFTEVQDLSMSTFTQVQDLSISTFTQVQDLSTSTFNQDLCTSPLLINRGRSCRQGSGSDEARLHFTLRQSTSNRVSVD